MIDVGRLVQFDDVTPELVQFNVVPPAGPETANVPVQAPPVVDMEFQVKVPEKLFTVAVPETVPEAPPTAHVPCTDAAICVRLMASAAFTAP